MLAMLILNINPNVTVITLKLSSIGEESPKLSPYESHHKKSTFPANSPSNPPITNPDSKNTIKIHILLSLVATAKFLLCSYGNIVF